MKKRDSRNTKKKEKAEMEQRAQIGHVSIDANAARTENAQTSKPRQDGQINSRGEGSPYPEARAALIRERGGKSTRVLTT